MREYSSALTVDLPVRASLTDDIVRNAEEAPDQAVFTVRTSDGWVDVSAAEFLEAVRRAAAGLAAAGVQHGDRVALLSRTRYEWTLLDYAIWYVGAVTVPIYETSSEEQVAWALSDSGAVAAVVETAAHRDRVEAVRTPELRHVWTIDLDGLDVLTELGHDVAAAELESRRAAVTPDDLATLVYTSGTTGRPKGCMLTHGNFMFELGTATASLPQLFDDDDAATLLFLPLAHVFARIIQIGAVQERVRLAHSPDIRTLVPDLIDFQPTFLLAVPRVFEKLYNGASQKATAEGKGRIFEKATNTAIAYSKALDSGRVGPLLRARHAVFERLVYGKVRATLGGRCAWVVSGGAPLGERLGHYYRGIGVNILEGYGLTETTAAITVNLPDALKIGSVGRPLPGTTIRVAEDGEILVKGGQVFAGYWRNEDATTQMLDADGWLHTGDLGEIDAEGFVRITGRKKEIIVTAGGKNVSPAVLEDRVRAHPLVSQCMVVGDGQPYIAALVTLDPDAFGEWARQHGKSSPLPALLRDPDLRAEIQGAVDEANKSVSKAESIRRFEILPADWTEEDGQLTPSLKLRRNVVLREFRADIDRLFDH